VGREHDDVGPARLARQLLLEDRGVGALDTARGIFRRNRGMLPTRKALDLGIHPRTLYRLRDEGTLEPMGRGLYRLAEMPALEHPDFVTVTLKVPRASSA